MVPEGLAELRPLGRQDPRQGRFGEFDGIHGLGLLAAVQGYMGIFKAGPRVEWGLRTPEKRAMMESTSVGMWRGKLAKAASVFFPHMREKR